MQTDLLPPDGRDPLPRHTTPTWEMELLLSAATVFGLIQLPALLDAAFYSVMPRFERETGTLILLPFIYIKSAVQVLVITFLLHLGLRGYWTALVGLRSVYPDGVHWDGLRWGPHYTALVQRRLATLPALVERADNRASQVFGFGIGFALALLAPLFLVGMTTLVAWGLHKALGGAVPWRTLWYTSIGALLLPYMAVAGVDRLLGRRLAPDSRAAHALSAVLAFYLRIGFHSFVNYPVTLFLSRFGRRRGGVVLMLTMFLLVSGSMVGQLRSQFAPAIGQYGPFAKSSVGQKRQLVSEHYADRRGAAETLAPIPFIETAIATGPYLALFIPLRPTRDNPALQTRCPEAATAQAEDPEALVRALDCLALLYPVALDGIVIADPQFDVADDAQTGLRGVQAMIPVSGLAPGRHELEIGRPPNPGRDPASPGEPSYLIPFWR